MKMLLPCFLVGLFVLQSCSRGNTSTTTGVESPKSADTTQVPGLVLNKFISLFPAVTKVEWGMEENDYEATFQQNEGEKSVLFTPEGDVISSETEINTNSLPEAMSAYVSDHMRDKKITKAQMVVTATGSITYEIEIEGKDYIFDGTGKFLKTEEEEGDEKD